jgi:hypothetical protein
MSRIRTAMAVLALVTGVGCRWHTSQMISPELKGAWTTDDPRYRDRVIELSSKFVIIVAGRDTPASVEWVNEVERNPGEGGATFTVYTTDFSQGTDDHIELHFSPVDGGELRIGNEPQVWRRRSDTRK